MTALRLAFAYGLDLLVGDPEWFPHPVRGFGLLIRAGENLLRPLTSGAASEMAAGTALTISVAAIGWASGRPKNSAWQVLLVWTALATRSLLDEARAVIRALEAGDLDLARRRLSRIVGRDTANLDETGISRAVVETLAESACDGIVAPLFWLATGGVPAAMAYKAINTLDSMIGHREPPYLYFGRAAARVDDAVNFLPARLTALAITAAARLQRLDTAGALRIWLRDGDRHASPNAGQSEAAMAGALGVQLCGASLYDGLRHDAPLLHAEGRPASLKDTKAALSLIALVSGIAFGVVLLIVGSRSRR
ncbi:MAG TPA: adenosylcobinamide-phosphate synthase CbiB [Bryobacteraceae bacterium]|nr:adenosylcobinamide-phosphate synthase CbiB [Bryobacteraceae bacterium]